MQLKMFQLSVFVSVFVNIISLLLIKLISWPSFSVKLVNTIKALVIVISFQTFAMAFTFKSQFYLLRKQSICIGALTLTQPLILCGKTSDT